MRTTTDLYELLGVPKEATQDDIRKAHRDLVRRYHPDANLGDHSSEEHFKEVQRAYEVLSDPEKRREYIRDSTPLPEGVLANYAQGPVQEREVRVLRLLQISPTS